LQHDAPASRPPVLTSAARMPRIDLQGWLAGCRHAPSPHCDARPANVTVDLLVIHNISLPAGVYGGTEIEDLFLGRLDCEQHPSFMDLRGLRVSAHFLIRRDGEVLQFVSVADRAWHAGVSVFQGRPACNDFSIGVELEGCDTAPFAEIQMTRLAELAVDLAAGIPSLRWVAGHNDIAPGRKTDPGPFFDWQDFARRVHRCGARLERPSVV
jgi:AmpD protein